MGTYLVERYAPMGGRSDGSVAILTRQLARVSGAGLRHVSSTLLPSDEVCLSLVEAPSAEAVRQAFRRAGLPADRVTAAVVVPPTLTRRREQA